MKSAQEREAKREYIKREIMQMNDAIEYLNISKQRLHNYVHEGRLQPIHKERISIFLKDDIIAFDEAFKKARANKKWLTEFE